jgi:hypothetical protein
VADERGIKFFFCQGEGNKVGKVYGGFEAGPLGHSDSNDAANT